MELSKLDITLGVIIVILLGIGLYVHVRDGSKKSRAGGALGIAALIDSVKRDLRQSEEARIERKESAMFVVKDFDLEIKFVATETQEASGKLELSVVSLDGTKTASSELVQTVKLHMQFIPPVEGTSPPSPTPVNQNASSVIVVH